MSGGGGGQGQDDKNSMQILWIIAGIFLFGAFIWWAFGDQLKFIFIKLRVGELYAIWFVTKPLAIPAITDEVTAALDIAKSLTINDLSKDIAKELSIVSGKYLKYPFIVLLAWFCYIMYGKNIKMKYKKSYNMKTLAAQECSEWPQINPVLGLDLATKDITNGPWAMANTPIEFCKKHKIITIKKEQAVSILIADKYVVELDKGKTERVFSKQLGRVWSTPENLPEYKQAILAMFIAKGCRDTQAARDFIDQVNRSAVNNKKGQLGKLNFNGAKALWKKHYNKREVQEIVNDHYYGYTVFTALFLFARQDGVFASSEFLWLKIIDREFWYVLNNVGRQTPFCEGAAAHAHFLAEKALRRPLSVPMIKEAVRGLELALNDIIYIPTREEKDAMYKAEQEMS